jgi:hypothetical protein
VPPSPSARKGARKVDLRDDVEDHLGADGAGVRLHLHHQLGALDHLLADPVLDIGGDGELTARLDALNEDRLEHGARGVDARGVAGGPDPMIRGAAARGALASLRIYAL